MARVRTETAVNLLTPRARGRRHSYVLLGGLVPLGFLTFVGAWMGNQSMADSSVIASATPVHAEAAGTLTVTVPDGALPDGVQPVVTGYAVKPGERDRTEPTERYIGGLYLLHPSNQKLQSPATLSLTYALDEPVSHDLTFAYWAVDQWVGIPSVDQPDQHTVRSSIQRFLPTMIAVVATEDVGVRALDDDILHAFRAPGADADGDGLTDAEEGFYGTDPHLTDTDRDTYTDGDEVAHDYDPNGPGTYARPNAD